MIDKVKKLLAMTESDNLHESETAMLHAQKLMTKYNIEYYEIEELEEEINVNEEEVFGKFKQRRIWVYRLGKIIAENFSCKAYRKAFNRKTDMIFIGTKDNIEIAKEIFFYAKEIIRKNSNKFATKRSKEIGVKKSLIKNDYIFSFLNGLKEKLEKQKEDIKQEYGLVEINKEVNRYFEDLNLASGRVHSYNSSGDALTEIKGYNDGKDFSTNRLK